jgi:hypothetical protein
MTSAPREERVLEEGEEGSRVSARTVYSVGNWRRYFATEPPIVSE